MNKLQKIALNMVCGSEPLTKESKKHLNQVKQQFLLMAISLALLAGMIILIVINS
jgi:hypothetical protein